MELLQIPNYQANSNFHIITKLYKIQKISAKRFRTVSYCLKVIVEIRLSKFTEMKFALKNK